eukprot:1978594-Prymnesium_polylepis.1
MHARAKRGVRFYARAKRCVRVHARAKRCVRFDAGGEHRAAAAAAESAGDAPTLAAHPHADAPAAGRADARRQPGVAN